MKKVKLVRKPERVTAWDMLDVLWQEWETIMFQEEIPEKYKGVTIVDWAMAIVKERFPADYNTYTARNAVEKFMFESSIYLIHPERETMVHLFGVHAMLFDVWGCEKHKITITTYDDNRMVDGGVVSCPLCNEKRIKDKAKDNFPLEMRVCNDEEWEYVIREAEFHRKWVKRSNWKYRLQNPKRTFWRYMYRIKEAIPFTLKIEEA